MLISLSPNKHISKNTSPWMGKSSRHQLKSEIYTHVIHYIHWIYTPKLQHGVPRDVSATLKARKPCHGRLERFPCARIWTAENAPSGWSKKVPPSQSQHSLEACAWPWLQFPLCLGINTPYSPQEQYYTLNNFLSKKQIFSGSCPDRNSLLSYVFCLWCLSHMHFLVFTTENVCQHSVLGFLLFYKIVLLSYTLSVFLCR